MGRILVINSGSSSFKCCLFESDQDKPLWHANLEWKENFRDAKLLINKELVGDELSINSAPDGLEKILEHLPQSPLSAIGHRVVHGGCVFQQPTRISEEVKTKISELAYLAPLHNPVNLAGIEIAESFYPGIPQFAVFDTAFHHTLSDAASTYPIPIDLRDKGYRRYGFHGISHAFCSKRAASLIDKEGKFIICHLGSGASLCAVEGGKSIDTTMGMTPLEGLMMASRSGSIDPGLLLHLLNNHTAQEIDSMLNKESGLWGISQVSEDIRAVSEAAQKGNQQAALAFDMFIHSLTRHIGMMLGTLRGLDGLIFTAGIGENDVHVREKACEAFAFLGLKIDPEKNRSPSRDEREISTTDSNVRVFVIPTQEEWEINNQIRTQLS